MASVATAPVRIAVIQSQSTKASNSPFELSKSIRSLLSAGFLPRMRETTFTPKRWHSSGNRQGMVVKKSLPAGCTDILAGSWHRFLSRKASFTHSTHSAGAMCKLDLFGRNDFHKPCVSIPFSASINRSLSVRFRTAIRTY